MLALKCILNLMNLSYTTWPTECRRPNFPVLTSLKEEGIKLYMSIQLVIKRKLNKSFVSKLTVKLIIKCTNWTLKCEFCPVSGSFLTKEKQIFPFPVCRNPSETCQSLTMNQSDETHNLIGWKCISHVTSLNCSGFCQGCHTLCKMCREMKTFSLF